VKKGLVVEAPKGCPDLGEDIVIIKEWVCFQSVPEGSQEVLRQGGAKLWK